MSVAYNAVLMLKTIFISMSIEKLLKPEWKNIGLKLPFTQSHSES